MTNLVQGAMRFCEVGQERCDRTDGADAPTPHPTPLKFRCVCPAMAS
nr:hypothetical protein [Nostoc sp. ChiQUE02]MDZ8232833.1 hypothetical protein [Nostoc sp. ChiQUE02]